MNLVSSYRMNSFMRKFQNAGEGGEEIEQSDGADEDEVEERTFDEDTLISENSTEELHPHLPSHLRCTCHTLSLTATSDTTKIIKKDTDLLDMHTQAIRRCTLIWGILRSAKRRKILKRIIGKALLRPVAVRWNSLFNSLSQLLSLKTKLPDIYKEFKIQERLQDSDFTYIEKYISCLRPIAVALQFLQKEKDMFYGYLLPTLIRTLRSLQLLQQDRSLKDFLPLLKGLEKSIDTRFNVVFTAKKEGLNAAVATFLHLKFRYSWLHCLEPEYQEKIREHVHMIVMEEAEREEIPAVPEEGREPELEEENFFDFGAAPKAESTVQPSPESDPEIELLRYTKDSQTDLEVLNSYPLIKKLFLEYNTPLASSAAVERLFNYATLIDLPKFNRLLDEFFELRVIEAANANFEYRY